MYGALRFLYQNFLTEAMLTPSSQATGRITGTVKTGAGVATLAIGGAFAGKSDLTYTLEIDSVTAGKEVGQATFRWKTDKHTSWVETGVLTRTTPVYPLSADGYGTGLTVAHTGGVGDDFALSDAWKWAARATYGRERLLEFDRHVGWRGTGVSETLLIDCGTAKTPAAILLHDHNLTSAATVTIQGNSSNSWGTPPYSYTFATITDPLIVYPTAQTYRYWRVVLSDANNPSGYLTVGKLYLGNYQSLSRVNASWGSARGDGYNLQSNNSEAGVLRRYALSRARTLDLSFGNTLKETDIAVFLALQEALVDPATYRVNPFWVHLFSDSASDLALMEWTNLAEFSRQYFAYLLYSGVSLQLSEVVKT